MNAQSSRSSGWCSYPAVFRHGLTVALMAVALGCGGEEEPCVPEPQASVRALYGVARGEVTPYPCDLFTKEDHGTPTGRRVDLPPEGTPVIERGLPVVMEPAEFVGLLNTFDGFSAWAPAFVPLSGEIDEGSLPSGPEESALPGSSVFVVDVSIDSPTYTHRIPVRVEYRSFDEGEGQEHVLSVQPARPLAGGTRYAVVVTRGVLAADGTPVGPTADFSYASGRCPVPQDHADRGLIEAQRGDLQPLFDDPIALGRDEVAAAVVFTTQSVQRELSSIRELLRDGVPAPRVDFDSDQDGQPDLYAPQDLPDAPEGALRLEHIGLVARGSFDSPGFRNPDGVIQQGADGTPQIVSTESLPFVLALPADAGKQPFPVVILQHGHGGRKEWALYVAGYLAEQGIAVVAIDLVEHGERPVTGHGFLDFGNIPAIRANFEQCVADVMRLVQALETDETIAALDFVPSGTGDGLPDLDPGRLTLVGESIGAQVAAMVAALEPSVGAVVVNVGGGGYASTLQHYLGDFYAEDIILKLGALVQTLFDRADPIHFYRPYLPSEPGGQAVQILMQEVIGDFAMPNIATENLARVFDCPLVRPYSREVEGLEIVDSPAHLHGLFQFDPARHGFLLDEDESPEATDAVRRQVTSFLHAYFTDGSGVIENPW